MREGSILLLPRLLAAEGTEHTECIMSKSTMVAQKDGAAKKDAFHQV